MLSAEPALERGAPMLEVKEITCVFGGLTALDQVSFSIRPGEIPGVIGPNGAGKTTLFNIVSGIYSRTSGSVFLNGRDISGLPPDRLARLGLVRTFQNIELFGQMTVLENLSLIHISEPTRRTPISYAVFCL